jgi:hypothetical protein
MQGRIFVGFLMCSLFFVVGGNAQRPNITEKPVWTLEFIKPRPEKLGLTLRYLKLWIHVYSWKNRTTQAALSSNFSPDDKVGVPSVRH